MIENQNQNLEGCQICGGLEHKRLTTIQYEGTAECFSVFECAQCGLQSTEPQPDDLAPYYAGSYRGNRHGMTARYCDARRLHRVRQFVTKKKR